MNWKDIGLRLFWTVVAASAGVLTVDKLPGTQDAVAAGTIGAIAGYNFILLLVRKFAADALTKPLTTADAPKP